MISVSDCTPGVVYELRSRNLALGVYTGYSFIGIRTKFGHRFLDSEDHWDDGGSARTLSEVATVPPTIPLTEGLGTVCSSCQQAVTYIRNPDRPGPDSKMPMGWWTHDKTPARGHEHSVATPTRVPNDRLFDFLDSLLTA